MTRHGIQFPLYEGEGGGSGAGDGGGKDVEYYKAEAKKAFEDRDAAKKKLRELETSGAILSPEDRQLFDQLKADKKKLEDEKLKEAGKFDELRQQLITSHQAEVQKLTEQVNSLQTSLRRTLVGSEFARANELFGGQTAKTILTPKIAEAYYGSYVDVQDLDNGDKVVVVKNAQGQVILDPATGKPAPFAMAIEQLIHGMPDKDAVLRGSGKTGSGSSGGAGGSGSGQPVSIANLKPSDLQTPEGRTAVAQQLSDAGGLKIGSAFDRMAAAGKK